MNTYKEGSLYSLPIDYYHNTTLHCTYISDGVAYFIDEKEVNYKKNLSTKKLYRFNNQYQSWDTIEDNLKLFEAYEAPSKPLLRTGFEFRGD